MQHIALLLGPHPQSTHPKGEPLSVSHGPTKQFFNKTFSGRTQQKYLENGKMESLFQLCFFSFFTPAEKYSCVCSRHTPPIWLKWQWGCHFKNKCNWKRGFSFWSFSSQAEASNISCQKSLHCVTPAHTTELHHHWFLPRVGKTISVTLGAFSWSASRWWRQ